MSEANESGTGEIVPEREGFSLVEDGAPSARIVTGDNPPGSVSFGAAELKAYIGKMSGAGLQVACRPDDGMPSVFLGDAARGRLGGEELSVLRRDGYIIRVEGGDLCIAGIDDAGPCADMGALIGRGVTHEVSAWNFHRGTLYGVYRLLEELGVRWYMPGEAGERVRLMAEHGDHAFCGMEKKSIMFEVFNRYLLLKLFYDPGLDEGNTTMLNDNWTRLFTAEVLESYSRKMSHAKEKAAGTVYEKAVSAFEKYYLGLMELGREDFLDSEAGRALQAPGPELKCAYCTGEIKVDGDLGEGTWSVARAYGMYDTSGREDTGTGVKLLHDGANMYAGITARGFGAEERVEILLDPEAGSPGYYHLSFTAEGAAEERYFHNRLSLDRESVSGWTDLPVRAECVSVERGGECLMEISLPLEHYGIDPCGGGSKTAMIAGRTGGERTASTSSALRDPGAGYSGRAFRRKPLHQPPAFNRLVFDTGPSEE